jgi:hypothetical protein
VHLTGAQIKINTIEDAYAEEGLARAADPENRPFVIPSHRTSNFRCRFNDFCQKSQKRLALDVKPRSENRQVCNLLETVTVRHCGICLVEYQ